jgi:hypothetical protein
MSQRMRGPGSAGHAPIPSRLFFREDGREGLCRLDGLGCLLQPVHEGGLVLGGAVTAGFMQGAPGIGGCGVPGQDVIETPA